MSNISVQRFQWPFRVANFTVESSDIASSIPLIFLFVVSFLPMSPPPSPSNIAVEPVSLNLSLYLHGGDLIKWDKARIGFYVGIDIYLKGRYVFSVSIKAIHFTTTNVILSTSQIKFINCSSLSIYTSPVWFLSSRSQSTRHLHALDKYIKPHVLPEKHNVTLPESWNHHTPWRKTKVMESQTQTHVALVWRGSQMCLRKKDGSLFHIRRSRITGMSVDIQSLRSLDRFFVFSGEQIQILACLSESKEDAEIITPFKVVEVMDKTVQRKLSDNGTSTPSGDGELSPDVCHDGQFATQYGDSPGKKSLDSQKDVSDGESILRMEDHKRRTYDLLSRFLKSHFVVRIAESGEPLWSKKTALVGDTKLDEKRKSGKKRPCENSILMFLEVSLQVYIFDCPKEPTIWNLLKWLIPWDNTIYQQPRSLPPPIRSTPSISSSSHKPLLSFGSGSQLFSFRHFRSYSMSALPVPNTTPVTGPVKTQSSKPSFDLKTGPVTQVKHYGTVTSLGLKSSYLSGVSLWGGIDSLFVAYAFLVEDGGGNLKSFNLLISILVHDLELVFVKNSHEVVHEYMKKTEFVELMRRLGALGDGNQDQSTLSDDEWDAAYLYLSFVLRKRGGESDGGRRKNGKMNLSKDDVLYIATKVNYDSIIEREDEKPPNNMVVVEHLQRSNVLVVFTNTWKIHCLTGFHVEFSKS
ncbi:LOW QUALITY PROTEIN: hypothetical protein HID58_083226 [Brassica napus]|uniref:mRNA cap 0 methyltransferase domain-containing protein n=1 Tax=Brassica napus TaxID=3708 RepID=A0ABQ7YCV6_BRANA|nr:LOW QUALITY PROTEIN: hypothetical protein HID58_083226 [Brassica napus]